ncbi:MAG: T9SS type A sorting domain-containing protein [Bacteroidetes bacterium]|nr:T9SS type A sorting domain-containing protein [Bacteroidota bacterium]
MLIKSRQLFFLILLSQLCSFTLKANPGDTSWVTIYNLRKLTYYGNYDTTTSLPVGGQYRKIRLHYILSTYTCPPGTQYCGSWDYTTQLYVKPQNNDTVEIARIITPYATDWIQTNRKHDYVVDVTDYASVLKGTTDFRFVYQGYSYGFAITLKLEYIEGVPAMDAVKVKNIYDGYFAFGKTIDSIEKHLVPKTLSYASPGSRAMIKNSISGHGSDNASCSEFCSKYYQVKLNNTQIAQHQIWRNDCGVNNIYPQTGTWLYERANWCPGAVVWPIYHDISALTTANTSFSVDIDMQPYTAPNQANAQAGYNFISQLITYSAPNYSTDVSIEDIISPTTDPNYARSNPACVNPTIKIKNTGSNTITQVVFNYGLTGSTPLTYTWTGSLPFLGQTDVVFPPSTAIYAGNTNSDFEVTVVSVNNTNGDQNLFNNVYRSKTIAVPVYVPSFTIKMSTNKATDPNTQKNETSWTLEDENGNIVKSRTNNTNLTLFNDTVTLAPGCYKFKVTDSGCDGISWWAYQYYTPNPGTGTLGFYYTGSYSTFYTVAGDFGCEQVKYFRVSNTTSTLEKIQVTNAINLFPNPASGEFYLQFDLEKPQSVICKVTDLAGKTVLIKKTTKISLGTETIDASKLASGAYLVNLQLEDGTVINKKLLLQK